MQNVVMPRRDKSPYQTQFGIGSQVGLPRIPGGPSPLQTAPYLDALYSARTGLVQQQQTLLKQFGGSLRNAIFAASPELAQASQYLMDSFDKPIPDSLAETYRQNIRTAQEARGFYGGSSPAQDEAMQLTGMAEARRQQLLPQLAQFGQGVLAGGGLAAPATPGLSDFAALSQQQLGFAQLQQSQYEFQQNLAFQQRQFEESMLSAQEQSDFARRAYLDTQARIEEQDRLNRQPTWQSLYEGYRTEKAQQYFSDTRRRQPWGVTGSPLSFNYGNVSGYT